MGSDGAREATFYGKAKFPSKEDQWDGNWIFQVKYHDILQIGTYKARKQLVIDIDNELQKICEKYEHPCDNYILLTNVPLSPVYQTGIKDQIDTRILPKYLKKIKRIQILGSEEICRFLDGRPNVRQAFSPFLVSGDIIAHLLGIIKHEETELVELVKLYCHGCFIHEESAALDDAGDLDDKPIELQKVLIDLDVTPKPFSRDLHQLNDIPKWLSHATDDRERTSALSYLLDDTILGLVLVGGPGEGKSTLSQYIAQVHRACFIGKINDFSEDKIEIEKITPRIPFRIILRDYAQWTSTSKNVDSLFQYLSLHIFRESGKNVDSDTIHKIIKTNPVLLILDGLDEVAEKKLRKRVLDNITLFVEQVRNVLNGDLRVVATTRPYGYSEEFDPIHYLHLTLSELSPEKAITYSNKWIKVREPDPKEAERIISTFTLCLDDPIVEVLTRTPLQVTILLVIIRARGTPPKQKEELYECYMDIIYLREQKRRPELLRTEQHIIYGLHKYLAYILHKRAETDSTAALMDIAEFREKVREYISYNNPLLKESEVEEKTDQIIIEASTRLVLIESPQAGKVGFGLTTTREFFAASHLVDTAKDTKERDLRFRAIARSPHWRNVALFFAGRVGRTRPGEAPSMIDVCRKIDTEKFDRHLRRGANLVCELVDDHALREDYNEIGAIQYCLNLFEKRIPEDDVKLVNTLKNLPQQYKERVIYPWFIERFDTRDYDLLYSYLNNYHQLFGLDIQLKNVIINTHSHRIKLWAIGKIIEKNIIEKWVIDLIRDVDDAKIFGEFSFYYDEIVKGGDNFLKYFSFSLSPKQRAFIACSYFRHITTSYFSFLDKSDIFLPLLDDFVDLTSEEDFNVLYLLGILELVKILQIDNQKIQRSILSQSKDDKSVFKVKCHIPYITHIKFYNEPSINYDILEQFYNGFKDDEYQFTQLLVSLFSFILDVRSYEKYDGLIKRLRKKPRWIHRLFEHIIGTIPTNDQENLEYHNHLISIINNYDYFINLINNSYLLPYVGKSKRPYFGGGGWGSSCSYYGVISKILHVDVNVLAQENLAPNIFSLLRWQIEGEESLDVLDSVVNILEKQLIDEPIYFELLFPLRLYNWEDPDIIQSQLSIRIKSLLESILDKSEQIIDENSYQLSGLYWVAMRAGVIDEGFMEKVYKKFNHDKRLPYRPFKIYEDNVLILISMLKSMKNEIKRLAGASISALKHVSIDIDLNDYLTEKEGQILWLLAQDECDIWRSKYIAAMSLCSLQWSKMWKKWLNDIKNSDSVELQNSWFEVINRARYADADEKNALLKFLLTIIESKTKFSHKIKDAALMRLQKIVSTSETLDFDEELLNLPLSKRPKMYTN